MSASRILRTVLVLILATACASPVLAAARGGRGGGPLPSGGTGPTGDPRDGADDPRFDRDLWGSLRAMTQHGAILPSDGRPSDLWPTIGESEVQPDRPWVIWSRFNGEDYDLAWSQWSDHSWQPLSWLVGSGAGAGPGDDLDADVDFDRAGRPMLVWWHDRGGRGRVYWSTFLQTRWLEPVAISRVPLDARSPTIEALSTDTVLVRYETPAGTVHHTLRFDPPDTITDDLNPLDFRFTTDAFELEPRKD